MNSKCSDSYVKNTDASFRRFRVWCDRKKFRNCFNLSFMNNSSTKKISKFWNFHMRVLKSLNEMHESFLHLMFILRFHFNTGRVLASAWAKDKKPVESWEKIEKLSIGMSSQTPPERFRLCNWYVKSWLNINRTREFIFEVIFSSRKLQ